MKRIPAVQKFKKPTVFPKRTNRAAPNKDIGRSLVVQALLMAIGDTNAQTPRIAARLKIFDPTTLATAKSL